MKVASPATNQVAVSNEDQKLLSPMIVKVMIEGVVLLVAEEETKEPTEVKGSASVQLKTKTPGSTNSITWNFLNTKVS